MCQVHKILKNTQQIKKEQPKKAGKKEEKKKENKIQIIKNTLKIALCYVPSTQNIFQKIPCFYYIFTTNIKKKQKKI